MGLGFELARFVGFDGSFICKQDNLWQSSTP
jgi:hypothetical protein